MSFSSKTIKTPSKTVNTRLLLCKEEGGGRIQVLNYNNVFSLIGFLAAGYFFAFFFCMWCLPEFDLSLLRAPNPRVVYHM